MGINRGKDFEKVVREAFEIVPNVSIDRLHDQMTGYVGSSNICDFIVYKKPVEIYIECKSVYGNTLPFSNITDKQWQGLLEKSKIDGVVAGVMCWWIDKDVTAFIHIQELVEAKRNGYKSIRFEHEPFYRDGFVHIDGKKKRIFFEYDMEGFLNEVSVARDSTRADYKYQE